VWSKNYIIAPGETFTSLAASPETNAAPRAGTPESRRSGVLALIPAGQFVMGSPASENGRSSSELEHRVTIAPFYLSATEVTRLEYEQLTGRMPSTNRGSGVAERERLPVETVSWFEAVDYCNMLSAREGLLPAYSISGPNVTLNRGAPGYRLPTEAEWEYACRAGTETMYYTGPSISSGQANYRTGSSVKTKTVGSYAPNPYGLYDMAGNVAEWVWDWYAEYGAERLSNPAGPARGSRRVVRGGSYLSGERQVRSASRGQEDPSFRSSSIGFRVARSAE
jgi:formylglycine-generating enzyme required for sulfatase activity